MSNEYIVRGDTLPDAYHKALQILHTDGEIYPCEDWETSQKEVAMTMVVEHPIQEPMISKLFIGGPRELEQYRQEMLYGILDFEVGLGNWVYTYHDRMTHYVLHSKDEDGDLIYFNQIHFVINELQRSPSSRRAVIDIRDNSVDPFGEEPACLQHIQFLIRDNKLDCKVLFRSNDACKATFMNAFALILLQDLIALELGVEVGTYTHRSNSFHAYERDFAMLAGYVDRIEKAKLPFNEDGIYEVAADYEGDWDEMMSEYAEEIAESVKELANRHSTVNSMA